MTGSPVATKIHAPPLRTGVVERAGLLLRLRRGDEAKLVLVSAPAGFGKTTLLAAHLADASDRSVAWLSLDPADNEPTAFWQYLVAALRTVVPGVGATLLSSMESGQPPSDAALGTLVNELHALPEGLDLVLDDYHVIDRAEIHAGLSFLVEHLPAGFRLIVCTRADPPLPLPRLRARRELVEIRAAELRFTAEDATAYLNDAMGLGETRTSRRSPNGPRAGRPRSTSGALNGRPGPSEFISGFAGNDRYIVDYLVDEVLRRQSESVRIFLMRTCFLERLSGGLCDAVTGERGSAAMLESLFGRTSLSCRSIRAGNGTGTTISSPTCSRLILPTKWGAPTVATSTRQRWFAAHDAPRAAIEHALAANDAERAADLIEHSITALGRSRQEQTMRTWLQALPDEVVRRRPVLGVGLVGSLVSIGAFDGIEERLSDAEKAIAALAAGDESVTVADRSQLPTLSGDIELYRAALAQVRGDLPAVIEHAHRSIALAPKDHFGRAGAEGFLGIAHWTRGEFDAAERAWLASREGLRRAGRIADVLGTSIALASINVTLGRLRAAARTLEDVLALAMSQAVVPRGTADVLAALGELHLLSGDVDLASQHLVKSQELGEHAGLLQHPYRWRVAMANLRQVEGDNEGALDLLEEAERAFVGDFFPNVRPIPAMRARFLIRQGRLAEASRWQSDAGIGPGDKLTYLREFEHVTLARLLLAERRMDGPAGALSLLDRLLNAAERGGRVGTVIEVLVLRALALRATGDANAALRPLGRALELASPEGFAAVFIDEGEPMAALLRAVAKKDAYARTLLTVFDAAVTGGRQATQPDGPLVPLSDRELEVLRLLRSDLDGPDIARELRLSLNTVRTHTKNIYEKLDVNNRRAAVRRAEELELLQRR